VSRTSTGSSSPSEPGELPPLPSGIPHSAPEVERTLERLRVRPTKRLGQSFLVNPFIADAEAALVATAPGEPVLEIGGGLGILTEALVRRGTRPLTVLERDPTMAGFLRTEFGDRITVLEGDALDLPWPMASVVVGNLPFSTATPIVEQVWRSRTARFVGMLQREVAERIASGPGSKSYGRLSIEAALYGTVELFQSVPSREFHPAPAVEGRVIGFTPRPGPLPVPEVPAFERAVAALFSSRRKQLGNLLGRVVPPGQPPEEIARDAGWPSGWERMRPEELAPEHYFRLSTVLAARRTIAPRASKRLRGQV
jgi:16S rRNA (adenine1518-N6/adenine1519-N6)-dimethyltransferase